MEKINPLQLTSPIAKAMLAIAILEQRLKDNLLSADERNQLESDIRTARNELLTLQGKCKHGNKVSIGEKLEQCTYCASVVKKELVSSR